VAGCSGHGNENSVCMKGEGFFGRMNDCQLLKKDSSPWNELHLVGWLCVYLHHNTRVYPKVSGLSR
jgi:hypothetical protein